ncbi:diguanylate cyclase [Ruminococcus sp. HUN007]|uniref:sensor domain-containing diguanylate cyclase n=1 Tax=Ruminococcus sp. HUN007 TaxID=1514668 RepID=UPI000679698C|nr:diguanylate cyclase [Ruminococcus sp. HUN007]
MAEKKNKDKDKKHKEKRSLKSILLPRQFSYLIGTATVLASLLVLSLWFAYWMYSVTQRSCYDDLKLETRDAVSALESNLRNDRRMLRVIAGLIKDSEDMESLDLNGYLSNYDINSQVTQIYMLLPGDELISSKGRRNNIDKELDFEKQVNLKDHISAVKPEQSTSGNSKIRNFVQIRPDGYCIGFLFSEGSSSGVAQAWLPSVYDDKGYLYVVDRKTGEVIIDTSPSPIDNINDIAFRQVDSAYTRDATLERILAGKSGYSVFSSRAVSETLYMRYDPIGIEDWEMVVVVPESAAFSAVAPVRTRLYMLIAAILVILLLYTAWLVHEFRASISFAEEKANTDVLTGLHNRNSYENYIGKTDALKEKLTCIYIDANGLHELNNSKGHFAGDQMLRFIADTLKVQFGGENIFRIGGDEFVVFQSGKTDDELERSLEGFNDALARNDYHAALGIGKCEEGQNMDQLIRNAETKMYEAKRVYYKQIGKDMRV